jgi:hypothetical protein
VSTDVKILNIHDTQQDATHIEDDSSLEMSTKKHLKSIAWIKITEKFSTVTVPPATNQEFLKVRPQYFLTFVHKQFAAFMPSKVMQIITNSRTYSLKLKIIEQV